MRYVLAPFLLLPALAFAQLPQTGWKPERPVELIVGASPGGANDRIGHSLQRMLQDGKFATR